MIPPATGPTTQNSTIFATDDKALALEQSSTLVPAEGSTLVEQCSQ